MKIEISSAYRNLQLAKAEIDGRMVSDTKLTIMWIILIILPLIMVAFIIPLSLILQMKPIRTNTIIYPVKTNKPIGGVLDTGWDEDLTKHYAPVIED